MLMFKIVFPVSITFIWRSSKLLTLMHGYRFLQVYENKMALLPYLWFLPKMVSDFYLNRSLVLSTFFLSLMLDLGITLHSLYVCRELAFYASQNRQFRQSCHTCCMFPRPQVGSVCFALVFGDVNCNHSYPGLLIGG